MAAYNVADRVSPPQSDPGDELAEACERLAAAIARIIARVGRGIAEILEMFGGKK